MAYNKILLIFSLFLNWSIILNSQTDYYIVHGLVLEEKSNTELKEALVSIPELSRTFRTDALGQFKFAIPEGKHLIIVEKDDYEPQQIAINLKNDTFIVVNLKSKFKLSVIDEVIIIANQKVNINKIEPGLIRLSQVDVQNLPLLAGTKDIVKGLQTMPGVQQAYEGSSNIVVRGGSPDQNLYLFDNVRIYNTNHALGLISSYNPAMVKSVDFYRGGFPACYNGFISSVLDVRSKDIITDSLNAKLELGIISGSVFVSSRLHKNLGLILSVRRTFLDLISKISSNTNVIPYSFADYSAKILFNQDKHNVSIGYFKSSDKMSFINDHPTNSTIENTKESIWGSEMFNIYYQYNINPKLNNELQFYYSGYKLLSKEKYKTSNADSYFESSVNSQLSTLGFSNNINISLFDSLNCKIGMNFMHDMFSPAYVKGEDKDNKYFNYYIPNSSMDELGFFVEPTLNLPYSIVLKQGVRFDSYFTKDKIYRYFLTRSAMQFKIYHNNYIKLTFTQTAQPMLLLTNNGLGVPLDIWLPSSSSISPQKANQFSIGYYFKTNSFTSTIEYFNKKMNNIITYLDGHGSFDILKSYIDINHEWVETVTQGNGKSEGIELFLEKSKGMFSGWISYTLSWTKNNFKEIENNKEFWSPYDRRHVINISGIWAIKKNWSFSINWQYLSGQPISLPSAYYFVDNLGLINNQNYIYSDPTIVWEYNERNNQRMKAVHHLDVCLKRFINTNKFVGSFEIGCYNVYNRKNPYYYFVKYNGNTANIISVSLFPAIPYVEIIWFPFRNR